MYLSDISNKLGILDWLSFFPWKFWEEENLKF